MNLAEFYRKWNAESEKIDFDRATKAAVAITEFNGEVHQSLVACEECGELIQAITKCQRKFNDEKTDEDTKEDIRMNLIEEMADVLFMIGAMRYQFYISKEEIAKALNVKIGYAEEIIEKMTGTSNPIDSY